MYMLHFGRDDWMAAKPLWNCFDGNMIIGVEQNIC